MQRRDRNKLFRLKNKEGIWVEGQKDIMLAIEDYIRDIYSQSIPLVNKECLQVIPNIVNQAINDALLALMGSSEVRKVVFSVGSLKAPGPVGLNGEFFKKTGILSMKMWREQFLSFLTLVNWGSL